MEYQRSSILQNDYWTKEEEDALMEGVRLYGEGKWETLLKADAAGPRLLIRKRLDRIMAKYFALLAESAKLSKAEDTIPAIPLQSFRLTHATIPASPQPTPPASPQQTPSSTPSTYLSHLTPVSPATAAPMPLSTGSRLQSDAPPSNIPVLRKRRSKNDSPPPSRPIPASRPFPTSSPTNSPPPTASPPRPSYDEVAEKYGPIMHLVPEVLGIEVYQEELDERNLLGEVIIRPFFTLLGDLSLDIKQELGVEYPFRIMKRSVTPITPHQFHRLAAQFFRSEADYIVLQPQSQ